MRYKHVISAIISIEVIPAPDVESEQDETNTNDSCNGQRLLNE